MGGGGGVRDEKLVRKERQSEWDGESEQEGSK